MALTLSEFLLCKLIGWTSNVRFNYVGVAKFGACVIKNLHNILARSCTNVVSTPSHIHLFQDKNSNWAAMWHPYQVRCKYLYLCEHTDWPVPRGPDGLPSHYYTIQSGLNGHHMSSVKCFIPLMPDCNHWESEMVPNKALPCAVLKGHGINIQIEC